MSMHPSDLLYALDWAVRQAESAVAAGADPVAPTNLAALRELRDVQKKEAGR